MTKTKATSHLHILSVKTLSLLVQFATMSNVCMQKEKKKKKSSDTYSLELENKQILDFAGEPQQMWRGRKSVSQCLCSTKSVQLRHLHLNGKCVLVLPGNKKSAPAPRRGRAMRTDAITADALHSRCLWNGDPRCPCQRSLTLEDCCTAPYCGAVMYLLCASFRLLTISS